MKTRPKANGPFIHRLAIRLFTALFAILVFWVLGFFVEDIERIKGPNYSEIEVQYVDQELRARQDHLVDEISSLGRSIENKREEMRIVSESSQNLRETIRQLIELRKMTVQKSVTLPEGEQETLSESLAHFLERQEAYQGHSTQLSVLTEQQIRLETEKADAEKQLEEQREPARAEFQRQSEKHRLKLASLQLLILIPILASAAFLVAKKRGSIYFPLFLGYGIATLLKVLFVIHKYFPTRYFKYILIFSLLIVVAKALIYFIRMVAFPQVEWLVKQYREAYERFLCPVCEYPIRTGPRKFLFWTRRTVSKLVLPQGTAEDEPYGCPACGTQLFEECSECKGVRHSLLPYCQHCNHFQANEEAPVGQA